MAPSVKQTLSEMTNQYGESVADMCLTKPVMIVFLRKFGCVFCEEAMKDIAERRETIEKRGVRIVLVHMAENKVAEKYFKQKNLLEIDHVSDPDCNFYEQFGLLKGKFGQLYGLQVWLRTAQIAMKDMSLLRQRHIGDGLQMPGVFLIQDGQVIESFVHGRSSDRPDYDALSMCCVRA